MKIVKKQTGKVEQGERITRKQAIKKVGVSTLAVSSLLFLNTPANAKTSGKIKRNNGFGNGDQDAPGNSGTNNNAENATKPKGNKK